MTPSPLQGSRHPSGGPTVNSDTGPKDDQTRHKTSQSIESLSENEKEPEKPFAEYMAELTGFQNEYQRKIRKSTQGSSNSEVRQMLWSEQRPVYGPIGAITLPDGTGASEYLNRHTEIMRGEMVPESGTSAQETAVGSSAYDPVTGM